MGARLCSEVGDVERRPGHEDLAATALLGGLDRPALDLGRVERLDLAAPRLERDQGLDAELREGLDEPVRALPLRRGHGDREREGESRRTRCARRGTGARRAARPASIRKRPAPPRPSKTSTSAPGFTRSTAAQVGGLVFVDDERFARRDRQVRGVDGSEQFRTTTGGPGLRTARRGAGGRPACRSSPMRLQ